MKKHFKVTDGKNDKYYVVGKMGDSNMALPLSRKDLAKKVAYDLNKQLASIKNEVIKNLEAENVNA